MDFKKSSRYLPTLPISNLVLLGIGTVIVFTSLFMISESGAYYKQWYPKDEYKGYWNAALIEIFLTMTAAAHFQGHKRLNLFLKFLMIFLFLCVASAASFNTVVPMAKEYTKATSHTKLLSILTKEQAQNEAALQAVKGQPINTAMSIKAQRKTNQEYKAALKNDKNPAWIQLTVMVMTVTMRIAVQATNLAFAHGFGILYRKEKRKNTRKRMATVKNPSVVDVKKIARSA